MIVHIWDPVHCVLRLAWRSAAAAHRLKPLLMASTLACGFTVIPPTPPVEAHPPPPQIIVPPPAVWTPPPPPFGYLPPEPATGSWTPVGPIPLGPLLDTPPGLQETQLVVPAAEHGRGHEAHETHNTRPPDCDTPETPVPPKTPVPEPATFGIFILAILGMAVVLRLSKPVAGEVKWVVLCNGGKL